MLVLSSTSDIVRVVTGAAVSSITVDASYVDADFSGSPAAVSDVNRTITVITTAATTTVVGSPSASTKRRNVKSLMITNNSSSASQVTVQKFDGTNAADLCGVTLMAGENLVLDELGAWHHHDMQGGEYNFTPAITANLGPTGTIAETFARSNANTNNTIGATGTLFLHAIYLYAGQVVNTIGLCSGATAAATTTNLFFALYDLNRNLLAQSANQGAYTWAANTVKELAMTSAYRVPVSGIYYVGVLQVATTIATIMGGVAKASANYAAIPPITAGTSTTGLTTALPNPAAAITAATTSFYAWVK